MWWSAGTPCELIAGDKTTTMLPSTWTEEARLQSVTLESMFADPGLEELSKADPEHPAVLRYQRLSEITSSAVTYPDELEVIRELTNAVLDRMVWAVPPDSEDYWSFIPDGAARKRVVRNIRIGAKYHDTVAEVFFWSWMLEQTQLADLVEEEGLPDIVVGRGTATETWAEVKRVSLDKNPARLREVLDKANNQLKRAQPDGAGIVFLSVDRPVERATLGDRIPSDVEPYLRQVERRLGSHVGTSLGRVVLVWDEFVIDSAPGQVLSYELRRRSVTREHRTPRGPLSIERDVTRVDRSVHLTGDWPEQGVSNKRPEGRSRVSLKEIVVGPGFREFNAEWDGIRPQHAIEALSDPDATFRYPFRLGPGHQLLATRRVTVSKEPYTLLLLVRPLAKGRSEIGEAYRLYDEVEGHELHRHPMGAFENLISRYGVPFEIPNQKGTLRVKFVRTARIQVESTDPKAVMRLFPLPKGIDALSGAARFRVVDESPPVCEIEWLWFLDERRYRADVRRRIG